MKYQCAKCPTQFEKPDGIDCTQCGKWFCDNCYNTEKGEGCHCHAPLSHNPTLVEILQHQGRVSFPDGSEIECNEFQGQPALKVTNPGGKSWMYPFNTEQLAYVLGKLGHAPDTTTNNVSTPNNTTEHDNAQPTQSNHHHH